MEEELQPYQFLETDYNRYSFLLKSNKTTAKYIGPHCSAQLCMTRPIGRDHRLILKILGSGGHIDFTTCDTVSLLANDKHLNCFCGAHCCTGRHVASTKIIKAESQVIMRRTADNRIEAVISDLSGRSSTEHLEMDVAANVPLVPVITVWKSWTNIQIIPDETGLQSVRSQINALQAAAIAKHVLGVTAADWDDLRSVVRSTASRQDLQTQQMDQLTQYQASQIQSLAQQISELTQQVQLLQNQVEQMKVGFPPVTSPSGTSATSVLSARRKS